MRLKLLPAALAAACLLPVFAQNPSAVLQITREVVKEGHSSIHEKTDTDPARSCESRSSHTT